MVTENSTSLDSWKPKLPLLLAIARRSTLSSTKPEVVISLRAKRVCEEVRATSSTSRSPSLRSDRTRSIVCFAPSRSMPTAPLLRPDHGDAAEAAGRAAVAHGVDLPGFPLAIPVQTDVLPGRLITEEVAGLPEVGRAALVGDVGDHRADLSALDLPKGVAAELEVVALVVDRVGAATVDQDTVIHAGHEIVERSRLLARGQPDVRHSLERHGSVRIGVAAGRRFVLSDKVRLLADRLVSDEEAALEDRKALRLDAVVVIAARRERLRQDAVTEDVDDVRADAELAQLVGRQERRAREIRLGPHGPVELGGMADRLVDRQRQVGRKQHEEIGRAHV